MASHYMPRSCHHYAPRKFLAAAPCISASGLLVDQRLEQLVLDAAIPRSFLRNLRTDFIYFDLVPEGIAVLYRFKRPSELSCPLILVRARLCQSSLCILRLIGYAGIVEMGIDPKSIPFTELRAFQRKGVQSHMLETSAPGH